MGERSLVASAVRTIRSGRAWHADGPHGGPCALSHRDDMIVAQRETLGWMGAPRAASPGRTVELPVVLTGLARVPHPVSTAQRAGKRGGNGSEVRGVLRSRVAPPTRPPACCAASGTGWGTDLLPKQTCQHRCVDVQHARAFSPGHTTRRRHCRWAAGLGDKSWVNTGSVAVSAALEPARRRCCPLPRREPTVGNLLVDAT